MNVVKRDSKSAQGNVGLGLAISYFVSHGYTVSIPLNDCQKYDLIVENGKLSRVQVKTATQRVDNAWRVELRTSNSTKSGNVSRPFDKTKSEILFIVCDDGTQYLIPTEDFEPVSVVRLGPKYSNYIV